MHKKNIMLIITWFMVVGGGLIFLLNLNNLITAFIGGAIFLAGLFMQFANW